MTVGVETLIVTVLPFALDSRPSVELKQQQRKAEARDEAVPGTTRDTWMSRLRRGLEADVQQQRRKTVLEQELQDQVQADSRCEEECKEEEEQQLEDQELPVRTVSTLEADVKRLLKEGRSLGSLLKQVRALQL